MQNKSIILLSALCLNTLLSCSQSTEEVENKTVEIADIKELETHRYGGWYCPDNLNGFPAVDINNWKNVPVVNGRMATKEETQNGTSLIYVDNEKYPNATPLDMQMPQLARYYCRSSGKEELIIIIQALNISNDSIVGFRYLNGGNGSARLNEVRILSKKEIDVISTSNFVTINCNINATKDKVWKVLTEPKYHKTLQAIFDKKSSLKADWINTAKVNFKYPNAGSITSEFAGDLYGNLYIQIDYETNDYQYVEKFFVSENEETKKSELTIVCGPYGDDFNSQKTILNNWAQKVKELSEKK